MGVPGSPTERTAALTVDELHRLVALQGLVPIPPHLAERVLAAVQQYRLAMQRLDESGVDLADIVTGQPYRAREAGGGA